MFFHTRCLQQQAQSQPNATRPIVCPSCETYCYVGAADRWELRKDHFYDGEIDANHVVVNGRLQPRPPEIDWNAIVRHPHLEEALRQRDWDDVGRGLIGVPPPLGSSRFERAFDRIYHDRRIRDLMRRGNWQKALAYLLQHYRNTLDYETLMPIVVYDVIWWIGLVSCVYWCICIVY